VFQKRCRRIFRETPDAILDALDCVGDDELRAQVLMRNNRTFIQRHAMSCRFEGASRGDGEGPKRCSTSFSCPRDDRCCRQNQGISQVSSLAAFRTLITLNPPNSITKTQNVLQLFELFCEFKIQKSSPLQVVTSERRILYQRYIVLCLYIIMCPAEQAAAAFVPVCCRKNNQYNLCSELVCVRCCNQIQ
jgi:hypothetical protein